MNTAEGPHPDSSAKQKLRNRKRISDREEAEMPDIDESAAKLLAFTIDTNTAHIVKLESVDAAGVSHELSDDEKAHLAKEGHAARLEEVLEEAFEAGIACVLGDDGKQDLAQEESEEDAELRHLLLRSLIRHSPARRLMQPDLLSRAILETLIRQTMKSSAAPSEGAGLQ